MWRKAAAKLQLPLRAAMQMQRAVAATQPCVACVLGAERTMAGHSKWANIKHRKGIADKKRAALFQKLSKWVRLATLHSLTGNPCPDSFACLLCSLVYCFLLLLPPPFLMSEQSSQRSSLASPWTQRPTGT